MQKFRNAWTLRYMSDDDPTGGGEAPETTEDAPEGAEQLETHTDTPPATPAAQGLSVDDVRTAAAEATRQALDAVRREAEEKQENARRQQERQVQRQGADPVALALEVSDIREDIMDELREEYKDLPADEWKRVKSDLRNFKSVAELEAVKQQGIHKTIADAAFGRAVKAGRIQVGTTAPRREPTGGVAVAPAKPRSEAEIMEDQIRAKFPDFKMTKEDYERYG